MRTGVRKWAVLLVLVVALTAACGENKAGDSSTGSLGAQPTEEDRCPYPSIRPTYLPWQSSGDIPEPDRRSYDEEIDRAQLSWHNPNNSHDGVALTVYPRDDVGSPEEPIGMKVGGAPGYLHNGSAGEHSAWWNLDEHCNFLELSVSLQGMGPEAQDEEVVKVARSLEDVAEKSADESSKYVGFRPDSRLENGVSVTPITFLDGSYAEVVAPTELGLRGVTASMYTGGGLGGIDRTMDFRYRDGSTFMHEGPLETYEGADGSPVEWWRSEPGTGCPNLVFRFGDWFVGVRTCQDELSEEERASWARLLSGSIVDGGFLVLSAAPPLKLAEADGGSPETYLGMENPFNWVKLTPGRCKPDTFATDGDRQMMADGTQVAFNRLEDGNSKLEYDWFVSWCEDELMRVQVQYAYEDFAKTAAEGLRLRDIVLAD